MGIHRMDVNRATICGIQRQRWLDRPRQHPKVFSNDCREFWTASFFERFGQARHRVAFGASALSIGVLRPSDFADNKQVAALYQAEELVGRI